MLVNRKLIADSIGSAFVDLHPDQEECFRLFSHFYSAGPENFFGEFSDGTRQPLEDGTFYIVVSASGKDVAPAYATYFLQTGTGSPMFKFGGPLQGNFLDNISEAEFPMRQSHPLPAGETQP